MNGYPNRKVNAVIYAAPQFANFTEADWRDMAIAALDQAGCERVEVRR